jgi:hypothetical protein
MCIVCKCAYNGQSEDIFLTPVLCFRIECDRYPPFRAVPFQILFAQGEKRICNCISLNKDVDLSETGGGRNQENCSREFANMKTGAGQWEQRIHRGYRGSRGYRGGTEEEEDTEGVQRNQRISEVVQRK